MSKDEILQRALTLPVEERAEVAIQLLVSLEGEDVRGWADEGELSPELVAEIVRRSDQVHSGEVELPDHQTVIADIRRRLAEGRRQ